MLEWQVVDHPTKFPQTCIADGINQHGPMVDTHRELRDGAHVYLSQAAVKKAAVLLGFVDGDEADARALAIKARDDAVAEYEKLTGIVKKLRSELEDATNLAFGRGENLSRALGRIAQLEARIAEQAQADLMLVGKAE